MLNGFRKLFNNGYEEKSEPKQSSPFFRNMQAQSTPQALDIAIGAQFSAGKDADWMELQFRRMNEYYKTAMANATLSNNYRMRYYFNKNIKDLALSNHYARRRNAAQQRCYLASKKYEDNIWRAENDQTCECKPMHIAIKEDLVTVFGLAIIIENFMLFNSLRFDTMAVGSGTSDPFGGDRALEAPNTEISIIQKGFAIPYGVEARHGAPFLADLAGADVAEVGIKDSVSTYLYSRSVFPESKRFEHFQNLDAYSILHITQLKAVA